jgi:hypothetical protein
VNATASHHPAGPETDQHGTDQHGTHQHSAGPSGPGSVVLELGAGIGALILETPPSLHGHEIEISPSAPGPRTHSLVRERRTAVGVSYAAVYPVLPAGDYIVWREDGLPAGRVTVHGGQADRFRWPEVTPASPG